MKKYLLLALVGCPLFSVEALTLSSEFLRIARHFSEPTFPHTFKAFQQDFRVSIEHEDAQKVRATVERIMDGVVVGSYTGDFEYGTPKRFNFGKHLGPQLLFNRTLE